VQLREPQKSNRSEKFRTPGMKDDSHFVFAGLWEEKLRDRRVAMHLHELLPANLTSGRSGAYAHARDLA
jgi:hypothetical protein